MVEAIGENSPESNYYEPIKEKQVSIKQIKGTGTHGPFQVISICERSREIFDAALEQKPPEQSRYWGYHLMLDCRSCDIDKITDRDNLAAFAIEMVKRIGMRAYGEPQLNHFATHEPEAAGYTLTQLIETSLISGHFVDKNGDCYLDIFSCKEFSIQDAKDVVKEFLNPKNINMYFLTRQA